MFVLVYFDHPHIDALTYSVPNKLRNRNILYCRVEVEVATQKQIGLVLSSQDLPNVEDKTNTKIKDILRIIDKEAIVQEQQVELAKKACDYYKTNIGHFLFAMIPSGRRHTQTAMPSFDSQQKKLVALNPSQQEIVQKVLHQKNNKLQTHLIYGITGSGKSRVYIELVQKYLDAGLGVIFLLPEIAISYQLLQVLKPQFQEQMAYLHSSLSTSQRFQEYQKILKGQARLVLGTRSAIFAPVQQLGLVIFDEEHDSSYKQNRSPRYNAKRIAYMRLEQSQNLPLPASIILGSATPSLESYYYAHKNFFHLHLLTKRATGFALPKLVLSQLDDFHEHQIFTEFTMQTMHKHLQQGNQVLVVLNRRGHSNYAHCRHCGQVEGCPHCSVSLSYHQNQDKSGFLKCHLCGYQKPYDAVCSSCQNKLKLKGKGTQKVENFLELHFSQYSFARLDHDSAREKDYTQDVIEAMQQRKISILLGTQMIAKGFDLPHVTLVVIANADIGLNLPDFRSYERVFQLLVQSAGRSGRHEAGEVIIQTAQPDHYVIQSVLQNDHRNFYQQEVQIRRDFLYPPFAKMMRYVLLSPKEELLEQKAKQLEQWLTDYTSQNLLFGDKPLLPQQILGPQPAPLYRLNKEYRIHLLAKDHNQEPLFVLMEILKQFSEKYVHKEKDIRYELDVDPLDVL